jgi:hypothetical protein
MGADYVADQALPSRSPAPGGRGQDPVSPALPTRTSRFRRGGRHSSPYQLSVPPSAPALVLAVPGPAGEEQARVSASIAASASGACPGVDVRVGYLEGGEAALGPLLGQLPGNGEMPGAVVVPVLAGPHPAAADALNRAVSAAARPVIVTDPLGPHPLLAEVMHTRLAEAGLARAGRAGRISVSTDADGVIVLAAGGQVAVQSVGVVAVLLASRLAVPVDAAPVADPAAVSAAAARLRGAGVTRLALAPCLIGPEAAAGELRALAAATRLPCAAPLGDHPAIGHLVAIRYGAALADPALAGRAG